MENHSYAKIVFVSFQTFILKTIDKTWSATTMLNIFIKLSLKSKKQVTVMTLKCFLSFRFFLFPRNERQMQILEK